MYGTTRLDGGRRRLLGRARSLAQWCGCLVLRIFSDMEKYP